MVIINSYINTTTYLCRRERVEVTCKVPVFRKCPKSIPYLFSFLFVCRLDAIFLPILSKSSQLFSFTTLTNTGIVTFKLIITRYIQLPTYVTTSFLHIFSCRTIMALKASHATVPPRPLKTPIYLLICSIVPIP